MNTKWSSGVFYTTAKAIYEEEMKGYDTKKVEGFFWGERGVALLFILKI